jgi:hypothetical protein
VRVRADANRLRNRAIAIAAGGLVLLLALIALIAFDAVAAGGGGVARDDTAVLVAHVGLAMVANRGELASTAGRTAAGESSTRGQ